MVCVFGTEADEQLMQMALQLAKKASACNEVPVGAVVVCPDGQVIGSGYNQTERLGTQRAHAEMIALEAAAQVHGDWRLADCWLFVTLEPCAMCLGLARLSRLAGVIYAAPSPQFGACLDTPLSSSVYQMGSFRVVSGVCAEASSQELRAFFKKKRGEGERGQS